jgi:regulator of cell morphogenesis and NO signaling
MSETLVNATVGDIVANDFRAAGVLERFGIDFCCGGRRPSSGVPSAAADPEAVVRELEALPAGEHADDDAVNWPVDRLIDHIESVHHNYVRAALPRIVVHLRRLVEVHGLRHSELALVAAAFDRLKSELRQHIVKEEQVLFPYMRDLAEHAGQLCGGLMSPFGSVENPIRMMEREHRDAGDEMRMIRDLTRGYTTPADGCTTFAVCMAELREFERDSQDNGYLLNEIARRYENGDGADVAAVDNMPQRIAALTGVIRRAVKRGPHVSLEI